MKNILIIFAFLLLPFIGGTQQAQQQRSEIVIKDWTIPPGLPNQVAGQASFYYKVTRDQYYYQNGYYYFKVYFFSGSYYYTGQWAGTYLENIRVFCDRQVVSNVQWVMFKEEYTNQVFHFYSTNPTPYIELGWTFIKIN